MSEQYSVNRAGSILDRRGNILYAADELGNLSRHARIRLAQMHTAIPGLDWESTKGKPGALELLEREGFFDDSVA